MNCPSCGGNLILVQEDNRGTYLCSKCGMIDCWNCKNNVPTECPNLKIFSFMDDKEIVCYLCSKFRPKQKLSKKTRIGLKLRIKNYKSIC